MLRFEHIFEEEPRYGDLTVDVMENPPAAKIEFSVGDDGVWLAANAEGFLYLARIFAEMGVRKLEPGYHFHRREWLRKSAGSEQQVSVELLDV